MTFYFKQLQGNPDLKYLLDLFFADTAVNSAVTSLVVTGLDDSQILERITKQYSFKSLKSRLDSKIWLRGELFKAVTTSKDFTYLDYGAGTGETAAGVLKQFPKIKTYVADMPDWHGVSNLQTTENKAIRTLEIEAKGQLLRSIPSNSIDIVLLEFVLHHVSLPDRERIYRMIHRILKPEGSIIVREHDIKAGSAADAYVKLEHLLYSWMQGHRESPFEQYQTKEDWLNEFHRWGFISRQPRKGSRIDLNPHGSNRSTTILLQKTTVTHIPIEDIPSKTIAMLDAYTDSIKDYQQAYPDKKFVSSLQSSLKDDWILAERWRPEFKDASGIWLLDLAPEKPGGMNERPLSSGLWEYTPSEGKSGNQASTSVASQEMKLIPVNPSVQSFIELADRLRDLSTGKIRNKTTALKEAEALFNWNQEGNLGLLQDDVGEYLSAVMQSLKS